MNNRFDLLTFYIQKSKPVMALLPEENLKASSALASVSLLFHKPKKTLFSVYLFEIQWHQQ